MLEANPVHPRLDSRAGNSRKRGRWRWLLCPARTGGGGQRCRRSGGRGGRQQQQRGTAMGRKKNKKGPGGREGRLVVTFDEDRRR